MKCKAFTFTELTELEENGEQLVSNETKTNVKIQSCDVKKGMWPQYDLLDGKNTTILALALPGYDIKRLHVDLEDGVLAVSAYDDSCTTGHYNSKNGLFSVKKHGIETGAFARVFDIDPAAIITHMWKEDGIFFVELSTT